jgi:beta-lactamase class A
MRPIAADREEFRMQVWKRMLATIWLGLACLATAAAAAPPAAPIAARAQQLVPLLNGAADPAALMTPDMLRQVPAAQLAASFAQIRQAYGKALSVESAEAQSPFTILVLVRTEKAKLRLRMATEPQPPHRITGLLVEGVETLNDSVAGVAAELARLPGTTAFSVAALGETGPSALAGTSGEQVTAIGSSFKLFVLAELVRQIGAGERRWSDVAPLDHRSLPSGILQDWPAGSPMTLHSLAALMISRSDNSAADTLLHLLGREKVEQLLPALGVKAAARNRPMLSTREVFAIKADPALTARWLATDEAQKRALLPPLDATKIDPAALAGAPKAIDSVEWFASPADLVRVMDWLRRQGDATALAILAINSGLGPAAAADFGYFGYKGGSETGVLQMTFLLRRKNGEWRAVSASWNNSAAALDEARFVALVGRLVALQK